MTPWPWLNYSLEILGILVILAWVAVCILFWRVGRAVESTRPSASPSVADGRTLGLVSLPGREHANATPPTDVGSTRPGRAT